MPAAKNRRQKMSEEEHEEIRQDPAMEWIFDKVLHSTKSKTKWQEFKSNEEVR